MTDALAQLLCPLGVERHAQEKPELKIARRGLYDHAWADRRRWCPPHALVGITVDHEGEYRDRSLELAALAAAQARRKCATLDVDVVAGLAVGDCSLDHALDVVERVAGRHQVLGHRV